jgi:DNA-binding NarL/FixJ family response regulator
LVDDHAAIRDGLSVLLERRGFKVLGSAGTAAEAVDAVSDVQPEVVVVDLDLPDEDGASLVRRLRSQHPHLKVVIYTGMEDSQALADALNTGADGQVAKVAGLDELVTALRAVHHGRRHLDSRIENLLERGGSEDSLLSPREKEVLLLLADGLNGEEAAERLFLSPETVRTHIRNSMAKLEAHTRTGAVVAALRRGELGSSSEQESRG